MCKLLRAYGARVDQINEWLKAPTDMAKDKKNQQLMDILKVRRAIQEKRLIFLKRTITGSSF